LGGVIYIDAKGGANVEIHTSTFESNDALEVSDSDVVPRSSLKFRCNAWRGHATSRVKLFMVIQQIL
jgi:hypothetical protein